MYIASLILIFCLPYFEQAPFSDSALMINFKGSKNIISLFPTSSVTFIGMFFEHSFPVGLIFIFSQSMG
ncbi:unnamed protein product [Meloidogyne enterolobii]|uniref:Uncharacterized protein n=1 Tax=Meloidogyne enterolobii TaxID=390850 RepID=A0ACB0YUE5_MELEN